MNQVYTSHSLKLIQFLLVQLIIEYLYYISFTIYACFPKVISTSNCSTANSIHMKWSHDRERYCHWSSPCQLEKFRRRSSRCLGLWRYTLAKLTWLWKHNNSTTSWKCISYLKIGDFPASHVRFTGGYFQSKGGMHSWRTAKGVLSGTSRRQWWRDPLENWQIAIEITLFYPSVLYTPRRLT